MYIKRNGFGRFWRIIGVGALALGAVAFYVLSTTPLPPSPDISIPKAVEFTIYLLSISWLISSTLVKIGLIFNKQWTKLSILSCVCFIFMLINMGLIQTSLVKQIAPPQEELSPYPYSLISGWLVSWFWIDIMVIMSTWLKKKLISQQTKINSDT